LLNQISNNLHYCDSVIFRTGLTECASPAAINDIWWRLNQNEIGGTYADGFGNAYKLLQAYNLDEAVYSKYAFPWDTRDA